MFSLLNSLHRLFAPTLQHTPTRRTSEGRVGQARKSPRRTATRRRLLLESLERREVFSASFDSAFSIGSTGPDAAFDVATDSAGNSYMAGYFSATVDFDPAAVHADDSDIHTATGLRDAYVAKYASDGSLLWVRQLETSIDDMSMARAVTTDSAGNAYVAGWFEGALSVGATSLASNNGSRDGFVAKLAPDGAVLWANRWGAGGTEDTWTIAVDGSGNVLSAGSTTDPATSSTNILVEKFGPSGTPLWAKQIGNVGGNGSAYGIVADAAGNIFVSGGFKGTVDFDPGPKSTNVVGNSNQNGFVLKLTSAGSFSWVSPFIAATSTASSRCTELALDSSGNIAVGGIYRGRVDFKPGGGTYELPYSTANNYGGGFITKLNGSGSLVWADAVGTLGYSTVEDLALDASGNVYVTGTFQNQADFDPGAGFKTLTSSGSTDVFVAKYSSSGAYQWAVSFGGTDMDWAYGIAVDGSGNVYVAGWFYGTADFEPDPLSTYLLTSAGSADGFRIKLKQS